MPNYPKYSELLARTDAPPGSSWGIFGPNDQVGTLNFIDERTVAAAATLVRKGRVFNLDHHLMAFDPPPAPHRHSPKHTMYSESAVHRDDWVDGLYMQASSQVDGLRHFRHGQYGFYNGVPDDKIKTGCPDLGINRYAERGIVSRGLMVDLARFLESEEKKLDCAAGEAFSADLIDRVAAAQGISFRQGDIVLLRTGFLHWYFDEATPEQRADLPKDLRSPGLEQSHRSLEWFWDNRIAVCASDNIGIEALPAISTSPFPAFSGNADNPYFETLAGMMHPSMIAMLGLCLGELWDLEALALDCATDRVFECMVTIKPLNLLGGVGSPANALAIK